MKRSLALALTLTLLAGFAVAQDVPKIVCDAPLFAFGTKSANEAVKHTYEVRNDGKAVLNISKVKPACGCTIANISSKVLQPGETAKIDANLNLKGRRGLQTKTITVYSNDPKTPQLRLTLKGTAATEIGLSPTSVAFTNLGEGDAATKIVTITNNGKEPLKIEKYTAQNNQVSLKLETVEEGQTYKLHVTASPSLPIGRISDFLTITTNNPKAPTERITVFGTVVGKLNVSPKALSLTEAPGTRVNQKITVKPGSVKNYQIMDVTWAESDAGVKVVNRGLAGFEINLTGIDPVADLNGTEIVIATNLEDPKELRIPVTVKPAVAPVPAPAPVPVPAAPVPAVPGK